MPKLIWNGALLDSTPIVVNFAASMLWKGLHPSVETLTTAYASGVKLSKPMLKPKFNAYGVMVGCFRERCKHGRLSVSGYQTTNICSERRQYIPRN